MPSRNIPFFNYPAVFKQRESEYLKIIQDVLSRGAYILQDELLQFEKNLADFIGARHAIGVADGTNALLLSLQALGIGPGDEVILPSHTYVASAASIHYAGATPVLVECGSDHMLSADAVASAITDRTRAIMPVQLNGRTCDMDALGDVASTHGLEIVEDAAQALGSKFGGTCAATFGSAGTFSFYPAKLLGGFGDGGAVITNDDEIARQVRLLRDHGRNEEGEVVAWGTNSRLDNLQAAILDFKLKFYSEDIKRRREIAGRYQSGLEDVSELHLPPAPVNDGPHFDVYQNYEIEADQRDALKEHLAGQGIGTIVQFGGKAIHQYPLGFEGVSLPFTESVYQRALLLPMHTALTDDDVDYVIQSVRAFYG